MPKPTNEEIDAEVGHLEALKPRIRKQNAFGDDLHGAIDAQISVLKDRLSESKVFDKFEETGNPDCDHDEGRSQHTLDNALEAWRWMAGEAADPEPPSKGWEELAK